ncbi:MAG: hypothetical protein EOM74_00840 [Methanomicrobia archaeon]|nr:hypothetical protein [Methanomicrobia archaeon]
MHINSLSIKNFRSFGNYETVINFSDAPTLSLIVGNNGAGKSSILEALTYCLYGKLDKINKKDLPNKYNKNCLIVTEMTVNG